MAIHSKDEVLENEYYKEQSLDFIICTFVSSSGIYYSLVALTRKLGFTIEEVYNAYIDKNKVNFERIANGY